MNDLQVALDEKEQELDNTDGTDSYMHSTLANRKNDVQKLTELITELSGKGILNNKAIAEFKEVAEKILSGINEVGISNTSNLPKRD